jgi:hypothetical protein
MEAPKQDNTPAVEYAKQSTHFSSKTERTQNSRGRAHDRRCAPFGYAEDCGVLVCVSAREMLMSATS